MWNLHGVVIAYQAMGHPFGLSPITNVCARFVQGFGFARKEPTAPCSICALTFAHSYCTVFCSSPAFSFSSHHFEFKHLTCNLPLVRWQQSKFHVGTMQTPTKLVLNYAPCTTALQHCASNRNQIPYHQRLFNMLKPSTTGLVPSSCEW